MKNVKLALLYGVLLWVGVLAIAMVLFAVRTSNRPLFESLIAVVLVLATVLLVNLYRSKVKGYDFAEGIKLGLIWMAINIGLDLLIFSWGPMKMPIVDYVSDIAATYPVIVIITAGYAKQ